jgi:phage shock protein E
MPEDIDRHRLQELHARGTAIVEVLPSEEYENEHLPGAISLPLGDLRAASAAERLGPDKKRPIVTYCQSVD